MAEIQLYGPRLAPFVQKVVRALRLKKLDFTLHEPEGPEDYRRWSPDTGLLPAISVDGERVSDSVRILDLLDRRYPQPPLESRDPKVAGAQRRLESWVSETFFYYWVNYLRTENEEAEGEPDAVPRRMASLGVLGRFRKLSTPPAEPAGSEFERRLADLENFLGDRPFFYGDEISRADLAVHSFLESTRDQVRGGRRMLAKRKRLLALMERVEEQTRDDALDG